MRTAGDPLAAEAVVAPRARREVGDRPEREEERRQAPGRHRPADPEHDLPEVVRTGDPAEQPALGDPVAGARGAQSEQLGVGAPVDDRAGDEERDADDEARIEQPRTGLSGPSSKSQRPFR